VFFRTKHGAHRAKILFGLAGLPPAAELHGNMTQAARLESLERFRTVRPPLPPHLSPSAGPSHLTLMPVPHFPVPHLHIPQQGGGRQRWCCARVGCDG
jgi:hypothetical protein